MTINDAMAMGCNPSQTVGVNVLVSSKCSVEFLRQLPEGYEAIPKACLIPCMEMYWIEKQSILPPKTARKEIRLIVQCIKSKLT